MYERFITLVLRFPRLVILVTVGITVAFGTETRKIRVDPEMDAFIPAYEDARVNLDELEEVFGSSFLTRIIVTRDDHPDGIYNPETLALIEEITAWVESRPEFETGRTSDLRSLSTVNNITGDDTGMIVEPFMEQAPADRAGAAAVRAAVVDNGIYVDVLVSRDDTAASIMVRESEAGRAGREAIYPLIRTYLDGFIEQGRPERFHISGRTIVEGLFGRYISQESMRMLPFVVVLLALFLYVSFRSPRGVLIPFAVLAATEIWLLGFVGAYSGTYYSITSIMPVLMVAIATADSIHLLAQYYEAQEAQPTAAREEVVRQTMREMGAPVLVTTVSTAIGFLSMAASDVVPIQEFGVEMAFGVTAALVLTLLFMPALLVLLPLDGGSRRAARDGEGFDRYLVGPAIVASRHPKAVLGGFLATLALSLFGTTLNKVDTSQILQFKPGHHLRRADAVDNERFAGSTILDVMIDGLEPGALKDPEMLRRIDRFQRGMEDLDVVGDTFSIVELIKRMSRVMNEDRPEAEVVPQERDLIAQYLLLYSISGDPGDFDDLVDYDYQRARLFAFINESGTASARRTVRHAERLSRELFPPGQKPTAIVKLAGSSYTNATLEKHVVNSQISTLVLCMPLLFVLMWIVFGRPTTAVLAIAPVSLSIAATYGAMGFVGLPVDISTTMLGAMALGIGLDFAVHYLFRYESCIRAGNDPDTAAIVTARTAGRALFYNAIVLVGGFLALLFARLYPQMKLGALVSATLVICYVSTMLLFPAALSLRRRSSEIGDRGDTNPGIRA